MVPSTLMNQPTLLMTRPKEPARAFVDSLRQASGRNIRCIYSPLIWIKPVDADIDLTGASYLLFTSQNGVNQLANRTPDRDIPALCVGASTADAANEAGFAAISAEGEANDLLRLALDRNRAEPGRFLHISGAEVACDIADHLRQNGVQADRLVLYRQERRPLSNQAVSLLQEAKVVVPLFSAKGAQSLMQETENKLIFSLTAVCISPFVSTFVRSPPASSICIAAKPTRADLVNALLDLV